MFFLVRSSSAALKPNWRARAFSCMRASIAGVAPPLVRVESEHAPAPLDTLIVPGGWGHREAQEDDANLVAVAAGFGRAISEVGASLMVGGNIAYETRTVSIAICGSAERAFSSSGISP